MATRKNQEDYIRVGAELRDSLIEDIAALDWEDRQAQADKIKSALQLAAPYRGGYLLDTDGWTWNDIDFLRDTLTSVEEDLGHSAMGRGMSFGNTPIARQIRTLREKL